MNFDSDADLLAQKFSELEFVNRNTLILRENNGKFTEILKYMIENEMFFQKIERETPSLESVFMKVIR